MATANNRNNAHYPPNDSLTMIVSAIFDSRRLRGCVVQIPGLGLDDPALFAVGALGGVEIEGAARGWKRFAGDGWTIEIAE